MKFALGMPEKGGEIMETEIKKEELSVSDVDNIELTFTDIDVEAAVSGIARRC